MILQLFTRVIYYVSTNTYPRWGKFCKFSLKFDPLIWLVSGCTRSQSLIYLFVLSPVTVNKRFQAAHNILEDFANQPIPTMKAPEIATFLKDVIVCKGRDILTCAAAEEWRPENGAIMMSGWEIGLCLLAWKQNTILIQISDWRLSTTSLFMTRLVVPFISIVN